ncbi:MAG: DoxX family protein [Pseudomonadota bacterium]
MLWIAGRLLLGGLFVVGGIHHMFAIPALTNMIAARGIPMPKAVLLLGTFWQTIAGLAFMVGAYTFWSAWALIVFTIVATVLLVNFWTLEGDARESAIRTCQSNCAIVGGLLIAAAHASSIAPV